MKITNEFRFLLGDRKHMEEKMNDYISKLDKEIDLCLEKMGVNLKRARAGEILQEKALVEYMTIASHRCTLINVKNDLINMLQ